LSSIENIKIDLCQNKPSVEDICVMASRTNSQSSRRGREIFSDSPHISKGYSLLGLLLTQHMDQKGDFR